MDNKQVIAHKITALQVDVEEWAKNKLVLTPGQTLEVIIKIKVKEGLAVNFPSTPRINHNLTPDDWRVIKSIEWKKQDLFAIELFEKAGNELVKFGDVRAGILAMESIPGELNAIGWIERINYQFQKRKLPYRVKRPPKSYSYDGTWDRKLYRIYK